MIKLKVAGAACAALLSMLALASTASAIPASQIVIPAGYTATLSGAEFCADDTLNYGYTLNGGAEQSLATGSGQCDTGLQGATIGPVFAPTTLLVYLTDTYCPDTYYSDGTGAGDHALVTPVGVNSWGVSITDCGIGGDQSDTRIPTGNGDGNLNVTVTLTPATSTAVCNATDAMVQGSSAWQHASLLQRELQAYGPMTEACLAIEEISPRLSCSVNQGWVTNYENWVAVLVREGWLTSAQGSYLDASASALVPSCKVLKPVPVPAP